MHQQSFAAAASNAPAAGEPLRMSQRPCPIPPPPTGKRNDAAASGTANAQLQRLRQELRAMILKNEAARAKQPR